MVMVMAWPCSIIHTMKLTAHRYGKSRVRLMKVLRDGDLHTIKELTARILLEGDFDRSYTDADNTQVVATDTMKNTLYVLAHQHLGHENEPFARRVAAHFLERYAQVSRVTVELDERVWTRLQLAGTPKPHPHSFVQAEVARPFTRLVASRDQAIEESGIRDLIILKSTASGFEGFHRDELTTLPETSERILATALRATWRWISDIEPTSFSYRTANRAIVNAMLAPFVDSYSPSVQATLFDMASAALDACPEINRITLTMPNLHCLPIDLSRFGRTNRHELFVPTDEPHGDIEATVTR
jgi:urate oxidase